MTPNVIAPLVIAPLIVWRLYARTRRNFGRQPIQPKRMWIRVGLFSAVTLLVATQGLLHARLAAGLAAGLGGGLLLGMLALKLTRFEIDGQSDCYFPNPWIGMGLTALFIGRLLYRFAVLYPQMTQVAPSTHAAWQRSPLTLAILGLLLGYYIAYYTGLLLHHRRVAAQGARSALK